MGKWGIVGFHKGNGVFRFLCGWGNKWLHCNTLYLCKTSTVQQMAITFFFLLMYNAFCLYKKKGFIRISGFPNALLNHNISFHSPSQQNSHDITLLRFQSILSLAHQKWKQNSVYCQIQSTQWYIQSFRPCGERSYTLFSIDKVNWGQQIEKIIGILASYVFFLECWMEPGCFKAVTLQPLWLNTLPWSTVLLQPTQPFKGL